MVTSKRLEKNRYKCELGFFSRSRVKIQQLMKPLPTKASCRKSGPDICGQNFGGCRFMASLDFLVESHQSKVIGD